MQLHEEYSNENIFGNLTCLQHFPSQNLNFTYLLNCNVSILSVKIVIGALFILAYLITQLALTCYVIHEWNE